MSTSDLPARHQGIDDPSREDIPGRVALSWTLAGGVVAGGFLVATVTMAGTHDAGVAPTSTTLLFVLGGMAGLMHGGALGYLARDVGQPRSEAVASLSVAVLGVLFTAPLAWLTALYIALTSAFIPGGGALRIIGVALAWLTGAALCAWAGWEGWRALSRAFARWPERREGTLITLLILAVLMLKFFLDRPMIWGTELQVNSVGAIILAFGATVWIALPVVLVVLNVAHKLTGDRWFAAENYAAGRTPPPT